MALTGVNGRSSSSSRSKAAAAAASKTTTTAATKLERSWPSSRHTTSGYAVGPVHDLFLNDLLSFLLPTQPATHLYKFILVSGIILVTPFWGIAYYATNLYGLCVSQDALQQFTRLLGRDDNDHNEHGLVVCSTETQDLYMSEVEYISWWVLITSLSLILWCYYQRRILWMLWYRPAWMDPTKMSEGPRLPASAANLRFFTTESAARAAACCPDALIHQASVPAQAATPNVWNLDGAWEFQLCPTVQEGLEVATTKSVPSKPWPTIHVPSNWMLQIGVPDIPIYTNIKYPFPCQPPLVPHANPTGVYRRILPDDIFYTCYQGDRYWLNIHAAESMVFVYMNEYRVGYAKDSRLPSTWNLTPYLRPRYNVLSVVVVRWSDGSYLEDQDHWWMAGLHRSVELVRQPGAASISDVFVQQANHLGQLQMQVSFFPNQERRKTSKIIEAQTKASRDAQSANKEDADGEESVSSATTIVPVRTVRWAVYDDQPQTPDGVSVSLAASPVAEGIVEAPMDSSTLAFATRISNVLPWSAEIPYLYTLTVSLLDEDNEIVQVESCRIGFRSISIVKGQVCWNGRPITVCGINRHEHDPDTGKVVSLGRMHQDVVTLKQNNFNAVRTSHYPQHPSFYKLCDYYGLYVIDEANLETHGFKPMGRLIHDKQGWEGTVVPRITRLIERDKNHACILAWSLGNEAGRGRCLWEARRKVLQMDPTRLVVYESGAAIVEGTGRTELTDTICTMYPSVARTLGLATRSDEDRPVILCEYSHAMGNSNGNLHLYWKEFWDPKVPRLQGGFIWDMIDQGLRKIDDLTGRQYFAYGGDFGDKINDLQFCINGMFTPDREPHPAVAEIRHLMQPVVFTPNDSYVDSESIRVAVDEVNNTAGLRFSVQNRYVFSTLEHLEWTWTLTSNRSAEPLRRGSFELKDPNGKEDIYVDLEHAISRIVLLEKSRPTHGNSYFLSLHGFLKHQTTWAKAGHILVTQQFPIKFVFRKPTLQKAIDPVPIQKVSWRIEDGRVFIERNDIDGGRPTRLLSLNIKSGGVESFYAPTGENLLEMPLLPAFTRPATDNDKGGLEKPLEFLFPGMKFHYVLGLMHNLDEFSFWCRWKLAGLDASCPPVVECSDLRIRHTGSQTQVHARAYCHVVCPRDGLTLFNIQIDYNIWGCGKVRVRYKVDPTSEVKRVGSLPRVGVQMAVAAPFCSISYFGRGPGENYPDRKTGSEIGHYCTTPQFMGYSKYIVPGENGSRSDCEWIALREEGTGAGLLVTTDVSKDEAFSCSALHYSDAELDRATHTYELPQRGDGEDPIFVHIDHKLMGLGGDTSWNPVVYPEFRVKPDVSYNFALWLVPLSSNEDDAALISRSSFPQKLL